MKKRKKEKKERKKMKKEGMRGDLLHCLCPTAACQIIILLASSPSINSSSGHGPPIADLRIRYNVCRGRRGE